MKRWCAVAALTLVGGCSNEANTELHLGPVSVGQQLIDLDAARKAGAINDSEYNAAKQSMLRMVDELSESLDR